MSSPRRNLVRRYGALARAVVNRLEDLRVRPDLHPASAEELRWLRDVLCPVLHTLGQDLIDS